MFSVVSRGVEGTHRRFRPAARARGHLVPEDAHAHKLRAHEARLVHEHVADVRAQQVQEPLRARDERRDLRQRYTYVRIYSRTSTQLKTSTHTLKWYYVKTATAQWDTADELHTLSNRASVARASIWVVAPSTTPEPAAG